MGTASDFEREGGRYLAPKTDSGLPRVNVTMAEVFERSGERGGGTARGRQGHSWKSRGELKSAQGQTIHTTYWFETRCFLNNFLKKAN